MILLILAISFRKFDVVKYFVEEKKVNIECVSDQKRTPLHQGLNIST